MSNIVIVGSANMDTTHYLNKEFPQDLTDEGANTIVKSLRVLGGKGANQAISTKKQAGKMDKISFVGCVGKDEEGIKIIEKLKEMEIDYSAIKVLPGMQTDGRIISVDKNGKNKMIGYGNCIKQLSPNMISDKGIQKKLEDADVVMIQMKMPEDTVEYIINYCAKNNKRILIDPTPPERSSSLIIKDLLDKATYLTPNEEEAYALSQYTKGHNFDEVQEMFKNTTKHQRLDDIRELVQKYPNVIATLGENGVAYNNNGRIIVKKTYPTHCKDSTGAGDTFNGAFIAAIARGENLDTAIDYALMSSSIKVRYEGAQNGMPSYEETKEELGKARDIGIE